MRHFLFFLKSILAHPIGVFQPTLTRLLIASAGLTN
jgi:hypothetical protein